MKKIPVLKAVTVVLLISLSVISSFSGVAQASVIGGNINSEDFSLVVGVEESNGYKALMGASADGYYLGSGRALNRLVIVDDEGRWFETGRAFVDEHRISIELPTNGHDKIVYLNARGNIRGGMGLAENEVARIVSYYQLSSLLPYLRFLSTDGQSPYEDAGSYTFTAGVGWVSDVDNGGGGKGLVDPNDWVSDVDNGGGGKGIVASDWESPVVSGLDANPDGTFIYAY